MTAVGDDRDDLVQQLADVIGEHLDDRSGLTDGVTALLASGLVTPVQPLRELADEWEGSPEPIGRMAAAELRGKLPPNE